MNDLIYTGIGSRETPPEILAKMRTVGRYLASKGFTLRSGGANGADSAFEWGCDSVSGKKEIFLPYERFNGHPSPLFQIPTSAFTIAKGHHPVWGRLPMVARQLMARNVQQVCGQNLDSNTQFIVCYTPNGSGRGGTGQAIRVAESMGVPVYDFGKMTSQQMSDAILKMVESLGVTP